LTEIKVRAIVEGDISGAVLFSSRPIAFLQGVDPERGIVSDNKHELYSKPFAGKVLVFPNSVGSSVGAYVIYRLKMNGVAPKAIVNKNADIITTSGCALAGIPLYDVLKGEFSDLRSPKVKFDKNRSLLVTSQER
jgi:predicted aconitase with swiveling domain